MHCICWLSCGHSKSIQKSLACIECDGYDTLQVVSGGGGGGQVVGKQKEQ